MNSIVNPHFGYYPESPDSEKIWMAFAISVCLHGAMFYLLPYFDNTAIPPMSRIQVELNMTPTPADTTQPATSASPVAETPPEKIVTPKPATKSNRITKEISKPLLSSPEPAEREDYVVSQSAEPIAPSQPSVAQNSEPTSANTLLASPQADAASSIQTSEQQPAQATIDEAWDGYGKLLYELVSKNKSYPIIAVRRNWEGQVTVKAKFNMGKLIEIILVEESGREVLDKEAMNMVRKAASQIPVRNGLDKKSFVVTIPVAFNLSTN